MHVEGIRKRQGHGMPSRPVKWKSLGFSLRTRLLLCLFLPVTVLLGVIGWIVLKEVSAAFEVKMQEEVELIARALERPITYSLERQRVGSLADALETVFVFDRVYGAYLYGVEGNLLAHAGGGQPLLDQEERFAWMAAKGKGGGEYDVFDGDPVFSFFVPLHAEDGERIGLLQVTRDSAEMRATAEQLRQRFLFGYTVFVLIFITLLAGGYIVSIARPLGNLHATMRRIELGRRHERASTSGPAELGALADALNRMLEAIERQQAELSHRELQETKLKRRLKSSEKLAALGEMAASIGHEIGTPLATIDGTAQRGLRKADPGATEQAFVAIRNEVHRLERFIRQLLSLGNSARQRYASVDLSGVLEEAVKQAQAAHPGRVSIALPEAGSAVVSGDSLRLEIAIKNIVLNALQSHPGAQVECQLAVDRRRASIRIDDDGPGIEPEERDHLFEPFVSRRAGGKGLGLALAERIITEHEGSIRLSDAAKNGARFTIELPCTREKPK